VGVLASLVAHEDLLDLLGGHDRHHPIAALALGLLQVRADMIELAIVPAGAVGPLKAQQGNVVCLGESRDRLAEAVPMRLNRAGEGISLPRCSVKNMTTCPPTCRFGT
jgi:hypothetical protein